MTGAEIVAQHMKTTGSVIDAHELLADKIDAAIIRSRAEGYAAGEEMQKVKQPWP